MALELKQQIRLAQQLVMTPQLQQAIKLLQLSTLELQSLVEQELVENPCLEEFDDEAAPRTDGVAKEGEEKDAAEGDVQDRAASPAEESLPGEEAGTEESQAPQAADIVGDVDWDNYMESRPQTSLGRPDEDRPSLEDNLTPGTSLADHLMWQLGFADLAEEERGLGTLIIGNLNEDGYLQEDLEALAREAGIEQEHAERVLRLIQEFDPAGVAARDLRECLLVQARVLRIEDPLALAIIGEHLDLLQKRDFRGMARALEVTPEEVAAAARLIGALEPRPGRQFSSDDPIYITPDLFVHKIADEFHVVLNEDGLPKLRVSPAYREVLAHRDRATKEAREYVREKLRSAVWLIKSIHQRQRTIVRVMESIIRFQREFFERGSAHLRPLNLRDVAEDIGMHESTVSRVTSNKYAQTPHGLFELKFFFNSSIETADGSSIASESVKERIREIIRGEDASRPLSDQQIAATLRAASINIARRTVTKYRESMRILPSTRRRQIS